MVSSTVHSSVSMTLCVQLVGPDKMVETTQMQVYVRHWHPSTYAVDKCQEIILSENTPDHLKLMVYTTHQSNHWYCSSYVMLCLWQLSELSGIPAERVVFAKAYGSFPCEMSVLDIENDLDWNPTITTVTSMPLSIYDDGSILYFKWACSLSLSLSLSLFLSLSLSLPLPPSGRR